MTREIQRGQLSFVLLEKGVLCLSLGENSVFIKDDGSLIPAGENLGECLGISQEQAASIKELVFSEENSLALLRLLNKAAEFLAKNTDKAYSVELVTREI